MISKQRKKGSNKVDETLFLSVLSGVTLASLFWMCIIVYDIRADTEEIHNTLDIIEETFDRNGVLLENISSQLKVIENDTQKLFNE